MNSPKIFIVTVCFILCASLSLADDFQVTPTVKLKQELNDNIFFTATGELDDFITTVSPSIQLKERTPLLDLRLDTNLEALSYAKNDELNAVEHFHNGRVNYNLTPLMSFSGNFGYKVDSRPDRDLTSSGLVLNNSNRETLNTSIGTQYSWTEKLVSSFGLGYSSDFFEDPTLSDSKQYNVNAGVVYDLGTYLPGTRANINFLHNRYDYQTGKVKNFIYSLGFRHSLTEKYSLSGDIGPRYTISDFFGRTRDDSALGGSLALNWKGETDNAQVNISRDEQSMSGSSGTTVRTGLSCSYNKNITAELSGGVNLEYRKNKSNTALTGLTTDEETMAIRPRMKYAFNDDLMFEALYNFTNIKNKSTISSNTTSRHRNSFFITLNYQNPLFD